jgi:hypothetical protein
VIDSVATGGIPVQASSEGSTRRQKDRTMRVQDEASLVSIVTQMRHLHEDLRRQPIPQFLPSPERTATIDAMVEMTRELEALTREVGRLIRALDRAR